MRARELMEALDRTTKYNDDLINHLKSFGLEAHAAGNAVAISRDSMVNFFHGREDTSYSSTLRMIRDYLPDNLYVTWSGKTDDDYFLEIYIRDQNV